jgi:ferredoxin-NADP reductase
VDYLTGEDRTCLFPTSLTQRVPGLIDRDVYLYGPPAMAVAVRESLLSAGPPAAHLHEERFQF